MNRRTARDASREWRNRWRNHSERNWPSLLTPVLKMILVQGLPPLFSGLPLVGLAHWLRRAQEDCLGLFPAARSLVVGYGVNDLGTWTCESRAGGRRRSSSSGHRRKPRSGFLFPTSSPRVASPLLKDLQPAYEDSILDRVGSAAFLRRLSPVESDPSRSRLPRLVKKPLELGH